MTLPGIWHWPLGAANHEYQRRQRFSLDLNCKHILEIGASSEAFLGIAISWELLEAISHGPVPLGFHGTNPVSLLCWANRWFGAFWRVSEFEGTGNESQVALSIITFERIGFPIQTSLPKMFCTGCWI